MLLKLVGFISDMITGDEKYQAEYKAAKIFIIKNVDPTL